MSLAIAYHMKRKGKKGYEAEINGKPVKMNIGKPKAPGPPIEPNETMEDYKKRTGKYAKGGEPRKPKTFDQYKKIFSHQESLEHKRSGENRGVHKPNSPSRPGVSEMGSEVRHPRKHYPANNVYGERTEPDIDDPKDHAKYALEQQRKVKGPTSGKSGFAKGGEAEEASWEDDYKKVKETKRMHGGYLKEMGPTGPTGYQNRNKSSDLDHGSRKGPKGYNKYYEQTEQKGVNTQVGGAIGFPGSYGTSKAGSYTKDRYGDKPLFKGKGHPAIKEHKQVLKEMKKIKGPTSGKSGFAEGGSVCAHCGGYADGGEIADFDSNDFENEGFHGDEANYTAANSGDELGDGEEQRRKSALLSYLKRKSA